MLSDEISSSVPFAIFMETRREGRGGDVQQKETSRIARERVILPHGKNLQKVLQIILGKLCTIKNN